jgi:hypothetical protein
MVAQLTKIIGCKKFNFFYNKKDIQMNNFNENTLIYNNLIEPNFEEINKYLNKENEIKTIDFTKCKLKSQDLIEIHDVLSKNEKVTNLILDGN